MSRDRVERHIHLPVPPAAVWHALTDGDSLATWFGAPVDLDARFGGQVQVRGEDGEQRGTVEAADEPSRLAFRLWGPAGEGSRVEFDLVETDDGTELTVTETRLSAASTPFVSIRAGYPSSDDTDRGRALARS